MRVLGDTLILLLWLAVGILGGVLIIQGFHALTSSDAFQVGDSIYTVVANLKLAFLDMVERLQ